MRNDNRFSTKKSFNRIVRGDLTEETDLTENRKKKKNRR